jgi:rRNA-processing protein FCF1
MRIKKLKAARKTLAFFRVHFKLRPPYKLIMDGCFLHNAHKLDFAELIAKLLQAEIAVYITHCVRSELEKLGDKVAETLAIARTLPVLKCGHKSDPLSPAECICKQVGNTNPKKYIVASTDTVLMGRLRVRHCCVVAPQRHPHFVASIPRRVVALGDLTSLARAPFSPPHRDNTLCRTHARPDRHRRKSPAFRCCIWTAV